MDFLSDAIHRVSDLVSGEDHEHHVKQLNVQDAHGHEAKTDEDGNLLEDDHCVEDAAIEAVRQEYANIKPSPQFKAGPVLRFQDIDVNSARWIGSALVVTDRHDPPRLVIHDSTKTRNQAYVRPRLLDTWEGNNFYRYDIELKLLTHREKNIEYWFETELGARVDQPQKWNFTVPALDAAFNWAFYSCNGFTSDVEDPEKNFKGANPLWDDLLTSHDAKPFHALVGGGDQIYNDDVLETVEMKAWLELGQEDRIKTEWTNDKKYAVEKYYFDHYVQHFTTGTYSKVLSLIPSVNGWDDHDILDGYGSYPAHYQLCNIMQGIGAAATRFYLLFQQHANASEPKKADLLTGDSGKGYNVVTHFGKRTLLVMPDTRSERSVETILSDDTYNMLNSVIDLRLLESTRHLVIVLGTPLVYPALTFVEETLQNLGDNLSRDSLMGKIFGKNKAFQNVLGQFGPELLDDLVDSWACNVHTEEKKKLVVLLQNIAKQRGVRVTFVGGDVHVGGAGRLFGTFNGPDHIRDPLHMTQIVSSAIVNGPPPGGVIHALHKASKTYQLNEETSEEMIEIFSKDVNGEELEHKKLLNRRNWCEVREVTRLEQLEFTLHVENEDHCGAQRYPILVDHLERN